MFLANTIFIMLARHYQLNHDASMRGCTQNQTGTSEFLGHCWTVFATYYMLEFTVFGEILNKDVINLGFHLRLSLIMVDFFFNVYTCYYNSHDLNGNLFSLVPSSIDDKPALNKRRKIYQFSIKKDFSPQTHPKVS